MDQFSISSANIPNIGDTRKAMLASFNIDTAADVTAAAVDSVPGFGEFLTGKLLEWRRGLEARFVFHPNRAIDPEDLRSLEREISDRRSRLETSLLGGPAELARVSAQILSARQVLWKELESANRDAFQARANARAA